VVMPTISENGLLSELKNDFEAEENLGAFGWIKNSPDSAFIQKTQADIMRLNDITRSY
jgi:hypothetical protein